MLPASDSVELRYTKEERAPCPISCTIHPWMRGYVVLRSNPYMAKTGADGRFHIKDLPVGRHVFQFWHERTGYLRNVRLGALFTDGKGRLTITIREGDNPLESCTLKPAQLRESEEGSGAFACRCELRRHKRATLDSFNAFSP